MPKKQLDDMLLIVRIMLLLGTVNIQPTDLPCDFEDCGVLYLLVSKYIIPGLLAHHWPSESTLGSGSQKKLKQIQGGHAEKTEFYYTRKTKGTSHSIQRSVISRKLIRPSIGIWSGKLQESGDAACGITGKQHTSKSNRPRKNFRMTIHKG